MAKKHSTKKDAAKAAEIERDSVMAEEADAEMVERYIKRFMTQLRLCLNGKHSRDIDGTGNRDTARAFVERVTSVSPDDLLQYQEELSWRGAIAKNAEKNKHYAAWLVSAPTKERMWFRDMDRSCILSKAYKGKSDMLLMGLRPLNRVETEWFIDKLFARIESHAKELLR